MTLRRAAAAEMIISTSPDDCLITYSLGSCLGVLAFDPNAGIGGVIHCRLPQAKLDPAKAELEPANFVDSGIPVFFRKLVASGLDLKRASIKAAGCSAMLDQNGTFNIGRRNHAIFRKMLWKAGILLKGEEFFGNASRTIALEMATGRFLIKQNGTTREW